MNQESVNRLVTYIRSNQNYPIDQLRQSAIQGGATEEDFEIALNLTKKNIMKKEYQVVIYQEGILTAFIPGGGKVDPIRFAELLNAHAQHGWRVITVEREIRRTLFFFAREAMIVVMERDPV